MLNLQENAKYDNYHDSRMMTMLKMCNSATIY